MPLFIVEFYITEGDSGRRDDYKEHPMWECVIEAFAQKDAEAWAEKMRPAIHANRSAEAYCNEPLEYPELIEYRVTDLNRYLDKMRNLAVAVETWFADLPPKTEEE